MSDVKAFSNSKRGKSMYQFMVNYDIVFCFLIVVCRIFLGRVIDDKGMGYLAVPMELYLIVSYAFSMPLAKTVSGLMKIRIKRGQYRNAVKIAGCSGMLIALPAVFLAVLYMISCKSFASAFHLEMSWMALAVTSVSVFFVLLSATPKGFLMGVSSKAVVLAGQLLETILCIAGLMVGARAGTEYGVKAAALLKNESMIYGYGAFGAMAGLSLGSFAAWILWMVLLAVFRKIIADRVREDSNRRTDDTRSCLSMIFNNLYPITLAALMSQGIILLLLWIFMHHPGTEADLDKTIAFWGCFYGKYLPLMMIPAAVCAYNILLHNSRIASSYDKDEGRQLRERMEKGLVKLNAVSFSGAVFIAVLGQAFAGTFFTGMTTSILKLISTTSVLIVCYCYFHASHNLLQKMQYHGDSIIIIATAFSVSAILSYLLLVKLQKGLTGVAVSMILFYLIGGAAACIRIYFITHVNLNVVRCFAYPALTGAISGIVVWFLNRLLFETAGASVTLLVCLLVGVFVDLFLLMAFHVVSENQIRNLPGGFIMVAIARGIGVI